MIFFLWLVSVAIIFSISVTARLFSGRPSCQLQDFVVAAFSIAGLLSSSDFLFRLLSNIELQAALGFEGLVALCVGYTLGAFFALLEVTKLF